MPHSNPQLVSLYGYVPTLYVCALYVALFSLSTILHTAQAVRSRLWWLFPTIVAGGTAEIIGWAGRLWSSKSPYSLNPFLMQITTTIMAPSFLTAANFLILGVIISRLGTQYSRLSPKWYSIVFITADVVALVVQAIGGGMASVALQTGNGDPNDGAHIMVGGIVWQLAAITVYVLLAVEFFLRVRLNRPVRPNANAAAAASSGASTGSSTTAADPSAPTPASDAAPGKPAKRAGRGFHLHDHAYSPALASQAASKLQTQGFGFAQGSKLSLMMVGLALSTLLIYMRSIYRTVELLDGWTGRIITTEVYFNVLDAMPITLAMFTINFLHPGWLLYGKDTGAHPAAGFEMMETDAEAAVEHGQE